VPLASSSSKQVAGRSHVRLTTQPSVTDQFIIKTTFASNTRNIHLLAAAKRASLQRVQATTGQESLLRRTPRRLQQASLRSFSPDAGLVVQVLPHVRAPPLRCDLLS